MGEDSEEGANSVAKFPFPDNLSFMSATITVLASPAGTGKSRGLVSAVAERLRAGKARAALMLVPTAADARAAVAALLQEVEGIFPMPVANFYEFVARILEHNQRAGREISPAERNLLIEHIIDGLASKKKIRYLAPLLGFRGLASSVGDFIKELKQNTIMPEQFLECTRRDASGKGAEMGAIYNEYQRILKDANLYDTEGRLWRVRDLIKAGKMAPFEQVEEIFIDNFANFTPSEFDIIKALSAHVKSITFAITCEEGERRKELFETTSSTVALIERNFPDARKAAPDAGTRAEGLLGVLRENLFAPLAGRAPVNDERIRIVRCPSRAAEAAEIGRRIKALLLEGRKADDIVVIARSLANYAPLFEEIFREQGIPFAVASRRRLSESAVARSVMHLLEIPLEDFSRHSVMRFLGSPYARALIGEFDAAAVDRVSREAQVAAGLEAWRERIASHAKRLEDLLENPEAGEDLPDEPEKLRGRLADAAKARDFADAFFARLEEMSAETSIAGYVERVLSLTEGAELRAACVDPNMPEKTGEDFAALAAFREELRRLAAIMETTGRAGERTGYADFIDNVRRLLEATVDASRAKPDGRVRIMEVADTRGLFFPIVFVCGLVEKEFPRQIPQSPFYNDAARREMRRRDGILLSEHGEGQKFEMFLFYTAVTRATERLYLTHPLVDAEGREAMPSYYLTEVERLFEKEKLPTERISPGEVLPSHENAVSRREMLAAALNDALDRDKPRFDVMKFLGPLAGRGVPSLRPVARAIAVVHDRESRRQYGVYDGILGDARIHKRLEAAMREAVLSASRLGAYGSCPFRYFAERILGLEEIVEPEDELTSINKGKFYHAILRDFFVELRERGSTVILEENCEAAAGLLEKMAKDYFEWLRKSGAVANEIVFMAEANEILEALRAFIAAEAKNNEKKRSEPSHFEIAFGFDRPLKSWDPASTAKPLVIKGGKFPIRVRGVIDRLDRATEGWIVLDYKTGSTQFSKARFEDGSDLQLPLYVIAVNEVLRPGGEQAVDGFYYMLKSFRHSASLGKGMAEICEDVKQRAVAHAANICAGRFPPEPRDGGACRACAAREICAYSEARAERKSENENETY
jgi:ATP-dependent helicase/nuclease subunit B